MGNRNYGTTVPHRSTVIKVAVLTAYPWNHALTWLRLQAPIQQAGMQMIQGNDYERIYLERIDAADLVVIQRDFPRWEKGYNEVLRLARSQNKPVVFELDDLLFELPEGHPDCSNHYYTQALFPMLQALLEADAVTCTTPALKGILQLYNPACYVLPNYLPELLFRDERLWKLPQPVEHRAGEALVIGYVGSSTHMPDLSLIAPALKRILERYGEQIILHFWGCQPPAILLDHKNVDWSPLEISDYAEYIRFLSGIHCDIGLAPLCDNSFNRCKSAIKFLEYSAAGIPGVYSRLAPYETAVEPNRNGLLAGSLEEWFDCLGHLIEDLALRTNLAQGARASLQRYWLLSEHAIEWRETYEAVLSAVTTVPRGSRAGGEARLSLLNYSNLVLTWQRALENQIDQQAQQIKCLEQRLAEQQQIIARQAQQLDEVFSSRTGRFIRALWRLRLRLIPAGSWPDRWLRRGRAGTTVPPPAHKPESNP